MDVKFASLAPLVPGVSDDHYIERPEHARILEAARHGANVLVAGPAGSGKTTMLRYLAEQLRSEGRTVTYVNAGGMEETGGIELLQLACLELSYQLESDARDTLTNALRRPLLSADASVRAFEFIHVLEAVLARTERTPVMILDGVAAKAGRELFGRLRDELWRLPLQWLVAARDRDLGELTAPPADAFFSAVVTLGDLPKNKVVELLEKAGVKDSALALRIASERATQSSQPAALLRMLTTTSAADASSLEKELADRAARMYQAQKIGRSAAMLLAELEAAPRSASDRELLDRLGWTRGRAAQVLGQLRDAGLVTSETSPNGRRTIYRVTK